ncbi:hypothetical protein ADK75_07145 [Streptomyces virginiae]|uniref:LD-carboxypeptidase n=1 Tax=Streptomyces virginiae TaxID=1961 RepID=A0A0L8N1S4_STRVG|nr:S66 peptidase family protein [Streptomyces virginiae]KOG56622.1 hypothetical protein ADK75_07145 [Streptomyces virginiae]
MKPPPPAISKPLRFGDVVGVVSPSSPLAAVYPRRYRRGLDELRRRGFKIRPSAGVEKIHCSVEERVRDLHEMVEDPDVRAIFVVAGGYGATSLLDRIDYGLLRKYPTLLIGYSDTTALLLAAWHHAGLRTLHGPALLPQLAESGGCDEYTWSSFEKAAMTQEPIGLVQPSPAFVSELLPWDSGDVRPRRSMINPGPRTVVAGSASGALVMANCETLLALAATDHWPNLDGTLLVLEESDHVSAGMFEQHLTQLEQIGVFEKISGLLFGRFTPAQSTQGLDGILFQNLQKLNVPAAYGFDISHTDPIVSLPYGVNASLDAHTEISFRVDGSAVQ